MTPWLFFQISLLKVHGQANTVVSIGPFNLHSSLQYTDDFINIVSISIVRLLNNKEIT